jgi:type 1 fimbriae regulatory protein FimB/type 1 fimbriae regulatory protein FimE
MILIAYRHGLRVSELVGLRWDMLDLTHGHLHVQRGRVNETWPPCASECWPPFGSARAFRWVGRLERSP